MSRPSNKIEKNCVVCNKLIFIFPSVIKNGYGKFCSLECLGIDRNKKIEKNCLICNKIFFTTPSVIKIGRGKFCSKKCKGIYKTQTKNTPEYFWSQVNIKENKKLCWEWKKYRNKNDYGQIKYNGKMIRSHRLAYFLTFPEHNTEENQQLFVCHTCDNPPCCNPYHLFLGTSQENMKDRNNKNRQAKGENSGSAKLTEKQVKEILLLQDILQMKTIAEMYKVEYKSIYRIFNNKTWKHVKSKNEI